MKKAMIKVLTLFGLAATASLPASAMDVLARVISSTPVMQQVAVPRQLCRNENIIVQTPKSGTGALLGAVAGGAIGNAIGNGGGRAAATMLGFMGGTLLGDSMEGSSQQVQNVRQCTTQTFYENQPSHYNVVYQYADNQYSVQMPNDPGPYLRLQVTPVGALTAAPQAYQASPVVQPQAYAQPAPQPVYTQAAYTQPAYVQPVYVQPVYTQPVYVQSMVTAPMPYPGYYGRHNYGPSFYAPPLGVSLNFGYSRGHGHGHWR